MLRQVTGKVGHPTLRGESAAERAARARESGEFEQQVLERAARFKSILSRQVPSELKLSPSPPDSVSPIQRARALSRSNGVIFVPQTENVTLRIVRHRTVRQPNWGKASPFQGGKKS